MNGGESKYRWQIKSKETGGEVERDLEVEEEEAMGDLLRWWRSRRDIQLPNWTNVVSDCLLLLLRCGGPRDMVIMSVISLYLMQRIYVTSI